MSEELKACPFCAKEMQKIEHGDSEWIVWCANCGAIGPNDLTRDRAEKMWNMRRPEAALRADNARMKAALEKIRDWTKMYGNGTAALTVIHKINGIAREGLGE